MDLRTVMGTLESIVSRDKSQLRFVPGLRNAIGVFVALLAGIVTGHPVAVLGVAIGAQVSGFAGLNGTVYKRLRTMLLTALWMMITTAVAGIVAQTWFAVIVIGILGFIAGFMSSVSNEAGLIGMWGTIVYILFSGFPPESVTASFTRGLLVLTGGLLQALLMAISERLHSSRAEARSVAEVYEAISVYALQPSRPADLRVATALQTAVATLRDSSLHKDYGNYLWALLDVGERVRIEIVALRCLLAALRDDTTVASEKLPSFNRQAKALSSFLHTIAETLATGKRPVESTLFEDLTNLCSDIRTEKIPSDWEHIHSCIRRAARDLLQADQILNSRPFSDPHQSWDKWLQNPLPVIRTIYETLKSNFTFQSAAFRHAIRLGSSLALAELLEHSLPFSRGYWLPLTTLVILRPEFATTFSRGTARVVGTLLGAVLATFILLIPDSEHIIGAILVALLLWVMYSVLNYNMVVFSGILTAEIVALLSFFENVGPMNTIDDRVIYTVLGSILAFAAYLLWPTWLHKNIPVTLADLVVAERKYVQAVFNLTPNVSREPIRRQTRLARTNTINLVNQAFKEPSSTALEKDTVQGLLTALNRLTDSLLSLESHILPPETKAFEAHPDVVQFGEYVESCLGDVEGRLRQLGSGSSFNKSGQASAGLSGTASSGVLDTVSPYTKQELTSMELPASLKSTFIRIEDNLGTIFRMLPV